jgi:hypothetical protein
MRAMLMLALLGGCAFNPYEVPGTWRPLGANDANLQSMVVRPGDLQGGTADRGADGQRAGDAVDRLRNDKVKPLPDSGVARISVTSSGGGQGGGR